MQVSIQGDDGRELKPFETGEICVIGPGVFAGYYDNPEANAKAFRDGWFRTGDLGHMDEEGFVYITGRASDMYISGGSNIYPREVEEKILTHPEIGEVAVLGVPDPVWGEVGVAVCVPREGAGPVTEAEMAGFLAPKVPRYKMPKRFFFWDALAEIRLRQDPEAAGARRARGTRVAQPRHQIDGHLTECAASTNPAGRRPSASNGRRRAAALSPSRWKRACRCSKPRAAVLPARRICRRRAQHQGWGARTVCLCDAGAVEDRSENAAFYSDIFRPAGITRLRIGAMTLGQRDRAPFFHCHGLWTEADGRAGGGHILPEETIVAEPFEVDAFGLDGALFAAEPDPETNFKLFGPIPSKAVAATKTTSPAYALRLRPNQDFAGALEAFCSDRAIAQARLHGGVGSIIGARFADGRAVEPFATEMAVRSGAIASRADGTLEATLDVALVDYTGGLAMGRLVRGDNPVLMTMELVLEVLGEGA